MHDAAYCRADRVYAWQICRRSAGFWVQSVQCLPLCRSGFDQEVGLSLAVSPGVILPACWARALLRGCYGPQSLVYRNNNTWSLAILVVYASPPLYTREFAEERAPEINGRIVLACGSIRVHPRTSVEQKRSDHLNARNSSSNLVAAFRLERLLCTFAPRPGRRGLSHRHSLLAAGTLFDGTQRNASHPVDISPPPAVTTDGLLEPRHDSPAHRRRRVVLVLVLLPPAQEISDPAQ
ncbi:hypothetical protein BST61_g7741 [Cercospora zeina]